MHVGDRYKPSLSKGGQCAGRKPLASEQARGRGMHAHRPIGSDHMLQSRGSEVACRQRKFPPHFQESVPGVKLGAGGYLL